MTDQAQYLHLLLYSVKLRLTRLNAQNVFLLCTYDLRFQEDIKQFQ